MKNFKKTIIYFLIAVLAYFAGDKKLLEQMSTKMNSEFNLPINITNNFSKDKIYFIGKYNVNYVVDGDTFHVKNENGKEDIVRLLAVNTLEKNSNIEIEKCFANKQSEFTKNYLLNKEIFLYGDKTQPQRDKYNRLLTYAATSTENFINIDNNYFFNDYLIETGNAKTYKASPAAYKLPIFEEKMLKAQNSKLNIWSEKCD